jgi:thiol-disulfide isomerase/thioredoxin
MKRLIFILLSVMLLGCNKPHPKEIIITLYTETDYGPFFPGDRTLMPSNFALVYTGVPKDLKDYVVRSFLLQPEQHYYNLYRNGVFKKELFLEYFSKTDTTKLTSEFIDDEVLILIGTNKFEKRVIIVDADNNNDFSGDKVFEYDYPISIEKQKQLDSLLPTTSFNYDFYINGSKTIKHSVIRPSPYEKSLKVTLNTDNEIEKKYYLFAGIPQYKKGVLKGGKETFEVCVSNRFSSTTFSDHNTVIFIYDHNKKIPSEFRGDIPLQIGDTTNTDGSDYLIKSISLWGDTLKLDYLGSNSRSIGYTEGLFIPEFSASRLDSSMFSINQYRGKFLLLDFWGTWCKPCIELVPELRKLNEEYKSYNFALVSIAYDNDIKKVADFANKERMNWVNVFIDENKVDRNSIIEKLKISSFPTTILIGPNGEIIARNKGLNDLREILMKKLNPDNKSQK